MSARVHIQPHPGGIVKRSLAMVLLGCSATIAKAFGLDDATQARGHPRRAAALWGAALADD